MGHHTEAFVGIDTSKSRNAIAIADGGRGGEVRYLGEFLATEAAIRKLVAKLAAKYRHLTFCYEAGPNGFHPQGFSPRDSRMFFPLTAEPPFDTFPAVADLLDCLLHGGTRSARLLRFVFDLTLAGRHAGAVLLAATAGFLVCFRHFRKFLFRNANAVGSSSAERERRYIVVGIRKAPT